LFSISKNHIKEALPKNIHTKTQNESPDWLAKIKEKPHCKGKSHFGKEKKEALELCFQGKSNAIFVLQGKPCEIPISQFRAPQFCMGKDIPRVLLYVRSCLHANRLNIKTYIQ
jgi:hypothetical protein